MKLMCRMQNNNRLNEWQKGRTGGGWWVFRICDPGRDKPLKLAN